MRKQVFFPLLIFATILFCLTGGGFAGYNPPEEDPLPYWTSPPAPYTHLLFFDGQKIAGRENSANIPSKTIYLAFDPSKTRLNEYGSFSWTTWDNDTEWLWGGSSYYPREGGDFTCRVFAPNGTDTPGEPPPVEFNPFVPGLGIYYAKLRVTDDNYVIAWEPVNGNCNDGSFDYEATARVFDVWIEPIVSILGIGKTADLEAKVAPEVPVSSINWTVSRPTGCGTPGIKFLVNGSLQTTAQGASVTIKAVSPTCHFLHEWITMTLTTQPDGIGRTPSDSYTMLSTAVSVDLAVESGGSDLDTGQGGGATPGPAVLEADEESVGAYVLVNWDDDNGNGVPDCQESNVANEDNLGRLMLSWQVPPDMNFGTLTLERPTSGWNYWLDSAKQTATTKFSWYLSNPDDRPPAGGIWIESTSASNAERDATWKFVLTDMGCRVEDIVKGTGVMIELGAGSFRENCMGEWVKERGHSALVYRYVGSCTREHLANPQKYLQIEMGGLYDGVITNPITYATNQEGAVFWGFYRSPALDSPSNRLTALRSAHYLEGKSIVYTATNVVDTKHSPWSGTTWQEKMNDIENLRCDGLVEVAYELPGLDLWGMTHLEGGDTHFSVYTWKFEHNLFDLLFWKKYLTPATQCGHESTYYNDVWYTTFLPIPNLTEPHLLPDFTVSPD